VLKTTGARSPRLLMYAGYAVASLTSWCWPPHRVCFSSPCSWRISSTYTGTHSRGVLSRPIFLFNPFFTLATKLTTYMASSLGNENVQFGQALHTGRMDPAIPLSMALACDTASRKDFSDRMMALERAASCLFDHQYTRKYCYPQRRRTKS